MASPIIVEDNDPLQPLLGDTRSSPHESSHWSQSFVNPALIWKAGALMALTGIVTGAFGAHAIKQRVTPDLLSSWQTASQYAMINGVALLAISQHTKFGYHRFAAPAIFLGSVMFSGTIFGLVLNREKFRFLGPVTPLGGTLIMAGYVALAL